MRASPPRSSGGRTRPRWARPGGRVRSQSPRATGEGVAAEGTVVLLRRGTTSAAAAKRARTPPITLRLAAAGAAAGTLLPLHLGTAEATPTTLCVTCVAVAMREADVRRPPRADRHREVWVPVLTTANANLDLIFHGGDEGEAVAAAADAPRPPAIGGGGDQGAAMAGAADAPRPPAIGGGAVGREPGRRRIRRERNARRAALNDGGAEAPARAAAGVPAEADADLSPTNKKLQSLYSSLLKKKELIQELLQGLRGVEECARAQAESPNRETIRSIVSTVLSHLASYDRVDAEATELRAQLQHPVPRPPELDGYPRDSLPPSVTRRLSRD
uniref:Uncharacterized protein n=1 Tax=Oryza barthii TaxID=65489 RepID=A0A0D3GZR4_9ORYZ